MCTRRCVGDHGPCRHRAGKERHGEVFPCQPMSTWPFLPSDFYKPCFSGCDAAVARGGDVSDVSVAAGRAAFTSCRTRACCPAECLMLLDQHPGRLELSMCFTRGNTRMCIACYGPSLARPTPFACNSRNHCRACMQRDTFHGCVHPVRNDIIQRPCTSFAAALCSLQH